MVAEEACKVPDAAAGDWWASDGQVVGRWWAPRWVLQQSAVAINSAAQYPRFRGIPVGGMRHHRMGMRSFTILRLARSPLQARSSYLGRSSSTP